MAPRRAKVNKFDYKKLTTNDVICPVCRSILIKPVTLPCSHGFCASCFETTTQSANLVCPLCRVRIGSWIRSATKSKKIINESLWQAIQELFPVQVRNKLNGMNENYIDGKKPKEKLSNDNEKEIQVENSILSSNNIELKTSGTESLLTQSVPVPTATSARGSARVKTTSSNNNQITITNSKKSEKRSAVVNNNFATKEYTCRILCQNFSSNDTEKSTNEYLKLLQRKNKQIQKVTASELNSRSNSIESECLYFKPIDYRHNPPSEGLTPIKVPTRKPNVNANIKINAPCGHNQINMNVLESAFARLFSPTDEKKGMSKKEIMESELHLDNNPSMNSVKRKLEKTDSRSKKKIKNASKLTENQTSQSKGEFTNLALNNLCDLNLYEDLQHVNSFNLSISNSKSYVKKSANKTLLNEESTKRFLQEKADFELATKLQQTFNQSSKYSTRSTVLKRMASKNQLNIDRIRTPYTVN